MNFDHCIGAFDWGNIPEWISVFVSVLAAVAATFVGVAAAAGTIVVAVLAYRTSKRATEIAEDAKGIALQQHKESVASREATARILVALLMHEISELPVQIGILIRRCDRTLPVDSEGELRRPHLGEFGRAIQSAASSLMPGTEQVLDRIHTLPENIGDGLAVLVGFNRTMNQMSKEFLPFLKVMPARKIGDKDELVYTGNDRDVAIFRQYLADFLDLSIKFAIIFRSHGGQASHDFSQWKKLVNKE